jgi:hypothetical protein
VTGAKLSERLSISARDEKLEEARALVIQSGRVPKAKLLQKLDVFQAYRIQQCATDLGSSVFVQAGVEATDRAQTLSCVRLLSLATLSEGTRTLLNCCVILIPRANDRTCDGNTRFVLFPGHLHLIL